MNKGKIITYIIIIFALVIAGILAFYFYTINKSPETGEIGVSERTSIFGNLFRGGDSLEDRGDVEIIGGDQRVFLEVDEQKILKLRKITPEPVAGFVSFKDDEDLIIRYTEKATGHVYETKTNSNTLERISNTTIPKIYESIWTSPNSTIIRYLNDNENIKSFYAEIKKGEDDNIDGELEGVFLLDNMKNVLFFDNQIFYSLINSDSLQGLVSKPNGEDSVQIFSLPLKELIIQRPQRGTLTLTTKPSYNFGGYFYFMDTSTEIVTKILGNIKGLTTLTSPDKERTIFSGSSVGGYQLSILDISDNKISRTKFNTFPEKCIWASNNRNVYCGVPSFLEKGNYPDDWYQGKRSFSDGIWKIDTKNYLYELIVSPKDFLNVDIDLIKPQLSEDEDYLFFINKKDSSLWSLEL